MTDFSPREIVSELDRHIVGQREAKRAVAIALRNRWRRQQLEPGLREEVMPKNILMIGPTGVGKTEIARRLARLANAPFIKVEATKFTEVGYVGRDVEQMIRDLLEAGIAIVRAARRKDVEAEAHLNAERAGARCAGRVEGIAGHPRGVSAQAQGGRARRARRSRCRSPIAAAFRPSTFRACPAGRSGMINLSDMLSKTFGQRTKTRRMSVKASHEVLLQEESDKLLDKDQIVQRGDRCGGEQRHRLPRRDRQDQRRDRDAQAPTSAARACSATSCR